MISFGVPGPPTERDCLLRATPPGSDGDRALYAAGSIYCGAGSYSSAALRVAICFRRFISLRRCRGSLDFLAGMHALVRATVLLNRHSARVVGKQRCVRRIVRKSERADQTTREHECEKSSHHCDSFFPGRTRFQSSAICLAVSFDPRVHLHSVSQNCHGQDLFHRLSLSAHAAEKPSQVSG